MASITQEDPGSSDSRPVIQDFWAFPKRSLVVFLIYGVLFGLILGPALGYIIGAALDLMFDFDSVFAMAGLILGTVAGLILGPVFGYFFDAPPATSKLALGWVVVLLVSAFCLAMWGMDMEYPTTVYKEYINTPSGNQVEVAQSVRDVTGKAIDASVKWLTIEGDWLFDGVSDFITYSLNAVEFVVKLVPWPALVLAITLLAFAIGRWGLAVFAAVALLFIGFMDLWEPAVETIALMVVAVAICMAIGLPLGVLAARSRAVDNFMRPILDGMQTMPSFVYLLPGVLFFGLGSPAGIFATLIYAVPPVIRLTNLGIRQVSSETVEAARSFGASPMQVLTKVQIPMALPTIMAGINQTTMMALAMVTIASMVAAGGLGDNVLNALQKLESGNGAIAGLAIVLLAILIDRLTQSAARSRQESMGLG